MKDDSTKKRYCPHLLEPKLHAVEVYRKTRDISFVCRRYHISKASLMRWNRAYDGTKNPCKRSPTNHIHLNPMPILKRNWSGFVITIVEIRTSPSVSYTENYAKKKLTAVTPAPYTAYSSASGSGRNRNPQRKNPSIPANTMHRQSSAKSGKWMWNTCQVLVIPEKTGGNSINIPVIEEASRDRFIDAYEEQSSFSTVDFFKRAIEFFGYAPNILQTDNGAEFTHPSKTNRIHPLDVFCNKYHIQQFSEKVKSRLDKLLKVCYTL